MMSKVEIYLYLVEHPLLQRSCHLLSALVIYYPLSFLRVIQVLRNAFSWKLDPHPKLHNANNVGPYSFVSALIRIPPCLFGSREFLKYSFAYIQRSGLGQMFILEYSFFKNTCYS